MLSLKVMSKKEVTQLDEDFFLRPIKPSQPFREKSMEENLMVEPVRKDKVLQYM